MPVKDLFSENLLCELDRTVCKPHIAKRIVRAEYEQLIFKLRTTAELVDVHSIIEICRDPKANFLLALAKDGNADYLITGDIDLLVLKEFENTKIVTISEFETLFPKE
jgi:putative PIN family toxin of toxin-antitoxin system